MKVDAPAAAVACRVVEDGIDVPRQLLRRAGVEQIIVMELDAFLGEVLGIAAAEIVDHAYRGAAVNESVNKVRADEGGSTHDEHALIGPIYGIAFRRRGSWGQQS